MKISPFDKIFCPEKNQNINILFLGEY